jgi:hypothetical protein
MIVKLLHTKSTLRCKEVKETNIPSLRPFVPHSTHHNDIASTHPSSVIHHCNISIQHYVGNYS